MTTSNRNHNLRGKTLPLSVAPMMDCSDRHFRYFMRLITRHTLLYTEMKRSGAVIFGDRERILGFSEMEKPLSLQVGGDDPRELAACARIAEDCGYDEININVGCPSERVQKGNFGACLMAQPERVADCVDAMRAEVKIPVTVKHRIGIDNIDRYEDMARFVEIVAESGCDRFSVHARIAWLKGLNPKENRNIPPLRYDDVYRLKKDYPHLPIEINGGITSMAATAEHLQHVDAVMIGRAAYENPYIFATGDQQFFGADYPPVSRREVIDGMVEYIERLRIERDLYPANITRHILGLFAFQPGTRHWRRYISENAYKPGTTGEIIRKASRAISAEVLDERPLSELSEIHC